MLAQLNTTISLHLEKEEPVPEPLQDNSYEENSKFGDSEDDFHRSDWDIHPNDEHNWEFCDTGNGNVRRVTTQISF